MVALLSWFKVGLNSSTFTMTTRPLPTADVFAHKSEHYLGEAGKRLHTARSRNDQVATDVRLYLRDAIDRLLAALRRLQGALLDLAEGHTETIMPGFTHMQVAQPVSFAHHLLAYQEMFARDAERLSDCRRRVNRLPLGAAALAGTTYPIRRERVAELLGFEGVCENSLDAVSDRDFAIEFTAAAALVMMHLWRLAEELILWMSPASASSAWPTVSAPAPASCPRRKTRTCRNSCAARRGTSMTI
jgi:argininosuccinate lyase